MLIAAIVYLMAVNPMAQSNGSMYAMQIQGLCAPYQTQQGSGMLVNQYLYHYCVLEPQEVNTHIFKWYFLVRVFVPFVTKSLSSVISGRRRSAGVPGRRRSHRDARLRPEDS